MDARAASPELPGASTAGGLDDGWRHEALRTVLTAQALVVPLVSLVWLGVRGRDLLDDLGVVALLTAMSAIAVATRFSPRLPHLVRAWAAVGVPFAACLTLLWSEGPSPVLAVGLALATTA